MTTDPAPNDDDDADTLAAFTRLLEKLGPPWLDKTRPPNPSSGASSDPVTSFLQSAVNKSEAAREKMAEQMDAIRAMLTPEQLTLLRSLRNAPSALEADPGQTPPPTPTPTPTPKRRRFL